MRLHPFAVIVLALSLPAFPQRSPATTGAETLHTEAVSPMRFVAVHGRRSVIMGYPQKGLEVWAYPFQILSDFCLGFTQSGATTETDARTVLRRIDYEPHAITRVYIGPDFLVRERLFVPLEDAAVVLTYEVEGTRAIDINIHFQPVLNLMWPAAVGGQYTRWLEDAHGYQITEPEHDISALIASPEAIAHDDTLNSTVPPRTSKSFTIRPVSASPGSATATVSILLTPAHTKDPVPALRDLSTHLPEKEIEATAHYADLNHASLRLHTPDEDVNRAVAWAEIALDQAWVCNPKLGCGVVAGYGPSRDARRPQYAWFFAGDGLIATHALVSAGEFTRARDELEFITKYQEPTTGMVWHELSQSAGYIDWSKFPYMYVHVDISFDYLSTVARYVDVSGDTQFAIDHWSAIARAYAYCRSLIRESDHLPHIPPDKEAGDEQARPGDDLSLSAGWLAAADGFANLAQLTGHTQLATDARTQNHLVRTAIPEQYWDPATNFWIDGHTQSGAVIPSRRRGPGQLLEAGVFSPQQTDSVLDQLATADFQTDWGLREVAASARDYDPYSYGRGSVTAPSTTQAAITFWKEHRPAVGNALWNEILPWNTLDSLGHIHEVLAGNVYQEQAESVPEQTWSSAGLVDAAVRGLLGLEIHGAGNSLDFTPHLPPQWDGISVENIRLPHALLDLTLDQALDGIDLRINNHGSATELRFRPEIPAGAHLLGATFQGRKSPVHAEIFSADQHASVAVDLPPGASHLHIAFKGGISIIPQKQPLYVGEPGRGLKLINTHLQRQTQGQALTVTADVSPAAINSFRIRTPWKLTSHTGVTVSPLPGNEYEVTFPPDPATTHSTGYHRASATLVFFAIP